MVGVCQSDNMALVIFLFIMNAFAESLEIEWKQKGIPVLAVMTTEDDNMGKGHICSHTKAMSGSRLLTLLEIFQCLYIDNGTFYFDTQENMIEGINLMTITLQDLDSTCMLDMTE